MNILKKTISLGLLSLLIVSAQAATNLEAALSQKNILKNELKAKVYSQAAKTANRVDAEILERGAQKAAIRADAYAKYASSSNVSKYETPAQQQAVKNEEGTINTLMKYLPSVLDMLGGNQTPNK